MRAEAQEGTPYSHPAANSEQEKYFENLTGQQSSFELDLRGYCTTVAELSSAGVQQDNAWGAVHPGPNDKPTLPASLTQPSEAYKL